MKFLPQQPQLLIAVFLGTLFVLYGIFIMVNTAGTRFYLTWFVLGIFAFAIALGGHFGWLARVPLLFGWGVATFGVVAVIVTTIGCVQIYQQHRQEAPAQLDALIVLGAQVKADGTPSASLQWRLEAAADYLKQNPNTQAIVCGGQGPNEPTTEAHAMAAALKNMGIAPERIHQENASTSTAQNLAFALRFTAKDAPVGIVTNDFHMYRALRIAQATGYTAAFGISAPSDSLFLPNNLLREFIALVVSGLIFG